MVKKVDNLLKDSKEMSRAIKKKRIAETLHCIGLINKIDDVLELDISFYYQTIIVKQLIKEFREK